MYKFTPKTKFTKPARVAQQFKAFSLSLRPMVLFNSGWQHHNLANTCGSYMVAGGVGPKWPCLVEVPCPKKRFSNLPRLEIEYKYHCDKVLYKISQKQLQTTIEVQNKLDMNQPLFLFRGVRHY